MAVAVGMAVAAAVIPARVAVDIFARKQWLWQPGSFAGNNGGTYCNA